VTSKLAAARAGRAFLIVASALALLGCQSRTVRERSPLPSSWTVADAGSRDVPTPRDGAPRDLAPPHDAAPRDATPRDGSREDARRDQTVDANGPPHDASARDVAARDASARDGGQDLRARDATAADWGSAFCGPLHFNCTPYACDVAAGQCKTVCTSNADCVPGKPCLNGLCGANTNQYCQTDDDCFSGHCAVVCCATACAGACHTCALPGTSGVCSAVPAGMPDPQNRCPAGTVCGANSACVPADAG
jgi:hypothetical protein